MALHQHAALNETELEAVLGLRHVIRWTRETLTSIAVHRGIELRS